MKNIWIFGDSFSESHRYESWLRNLITNDYNIVNYAMGSMDMQSIIDYWLKTLPKIKTDDVLIINLTEPTRYRIALHPALVGQQLNPYSMPKTGEYFIQNKFHPLGIGYSELIQNGWLESLNREPGKTFYIEKMLNKQTYIGFIKHLEVEHSSQFYFENQKELVEALYQITPCSKKFIWSWNDLYQSDFIFTKSKMKELIFNGYWETEHDVYLKTNGEFGKKDDHHISPNSNKILAEYIKNYLYL